VTIHNRIGILLERNIDDVWLQFRRWSVRVLLAFTQAAPSGIWVNISEKEHTHERKHNNVIVWFFHKLEDNEFALFYLYRSFLRIPFCAFG